MSFIQFSHRRIFLPSDFKYFGKKITIYPLARIISPEVIEIDDYSQIDDFTFIYGGKGIKLGKHVHIASFVSITGGGELEMHNHTCLAAGSRIITGTNKHQGGYHMSAASPIKEQNIERGKIVLEKDAYVGTNCVIHPNVIIGEGAVIGSNSLVLKDVEPWTINVGSPCKVIGMRERVRSFE